MATPHPRLTSISAVRQWIEEQGFTPSKSLGQNFLIDANILTIMMEAAGVSAGDRVLEIGPGLGVMTGELLRRAEQVVAVEKDRRLASGLLERLGNPANLELITDDALRVDLAGIKRTRGLNKLVANLPYSVGSRLLVNALMLNEGFDLIAITVQLEVAERIGAACGTSDYGLLGIWSQLDYEVRVAKRISSGCFYPKPSVTSAIAVLERKRSRRASLSSPALFDSLIKGAFSKRRKQISTILQGYRHPEMTVDPAEALRTAGIDPARRPETISVDEWITLCRSLQG